MKNNINKILASPAYNASHSTGAEMGRRNQLPDSPIPERLHIQRMRFVDGDYDTGGAYWGGGLGEGMYCAFSPDSTDNDSPIMVFVRGIDRADAKARVLDLLPGTDWTFYR